MIWFIAGLAFALFNAGTMLVNQRYKVNGRLISGIRGVGIALAYSPALLFVAFPQKWEFWALVISEGFFSSFFNERLYSSSAKFGAGSTSRISMLAVLFGLVFWWIIDYQRFIALLESPFVFAGLLFSVGTICYGFYRMSSSGAQRGQLAYLMPAVIVLAIMMIIRKLAMEIEPFSTAAVYYAVCAIFISGAVNLTIYRVKNGREKFVGSISTSYVIKAGALMVVISGITIFCGNFASLYVPNPAYLSALTLTSPIWIMLFNRAENIPDKVSKLWVSVMLVGLAALIFFAQISLPVSYDTPISTR